jgi:flagellar biosynthesis protein FlhG
MAISFPTSPRGQHPAWGPVAPDADAPGRPRPAEAAQGERESAARGERESAARIWAVGGGKGGVGKSVVTASLAAAMAASGRRCAVVDADLGGANLHTLLGVSRPRYTLSNLLTGDVASLADLMLQTSVPNLWLVSGNQALLEMANPSFRQREMLLRQIRELDVDDIVLDLGAGSSFTVLDFFLLARRGLVVVTPEPTSLENAEHFLRAAFHRSLREVARRPDVRAAIRRLRDTGSSRRVSSARELIALVRAIDPPAAKPLEERALAFSPLLVVNQVQTPEHRRVGPQLVAVCRERLGVEIELAGCLEADPNVPAAVARRQPALQAFPASGFSRTIEALAQRLQRGDPRAAHEHRGGSDCRCGEHEHRHAGPTEIPARPRALPALDRTQPGAYLRHCREALGLSLAEMTERTRIRGLDHIEAERFDQLPPEPYLKGYLLEYARELGIPELAELARCYLAKCPDAAPPAPAQAAETPPPVLAPKRRFARWLS